jgi:AraC-like DNA-binding protein
MQFEVVQPSVEISPWVSAGMHVAFDSPGMALLPCHFPALIEGGLTLVLEGGFFAAAPTGELLALPAGFLSSARAQALVLYRTPRLRCVGLQLQPAGTIAMLRQSPATLPHQMADAADVFGRAWMHLAERLHATSHPLERVSLLMAFAGERLCQEVHRDRVRRAKKLQLAALEGTSPQDAVGVATRQFERMFNDTFGLRPKLFQRVGRVENLLRDALVSGRSDAALALHHGYYDQSHMARDLRLMVGVPLRTLIKSVATPDSEYWALAVGTSSRRLPAWT